MKVVSVVGARPQFVKAYPISRTIRRDHTEVLVHTGQHYDKELSDVFFRELDIPEPDYNLEVGSDTHAIQTAEIMRDLDRVLDEVAADVVLTYGDTNSTLGAALVTAKRTPLLGHIEAGLRSENWSMAEEVNRVLTDHASDILFAPSKSAVRNLADEGITEGVRLTGDVMYDALTLIRQESVGSTILSEIGVREGDYILATVHRAANTDDHARLSAIIDGLSSAHKPVVFPCHPRTKASLQSADLWDAAMNRFNVIDPVGYLDFVKLLEGASRVATDSGGVQKEAFFLDTPCITLRNETEWVETVRAGWNVLVGANQNQIRKALDAPFQLGNKPMPYGDGNAAERIVSALPDAVSKSAVIR